MNKEFAKATIREMLERAKVPPITTNLIIDLVNSIEPEAKEDERKYWGEPGKQWTHPPKGKPLAPDAPEVEGLCVRLQPSALDELNVFNSVPVVLDEVQCCEWQKDHDRLLLKAAAEEILSSESLAVLIEQMIESALGKFRAELVGALKRTTATDPVAKLLERKEG